MEYPKIAYLCIEDGKTEIDPDTFVANKQLYDVSRGASLFIYFPGLGEGNFASDWCGYVIDELIELCLHRDEGEVIPFHVIGSKLRQKIRSERINSILP